MPSKINIHPLLFDKTFLKVFYKERNKLGKLNFPKKWHLKKVNSFYQNLQIDSLSIRSSERLDDVIVSLTMKPGREIYLDRVIKSLLFQSLLPHKIILWIAKEEFKRENLPAALLALESDIFEIQFIEKNLRSYNKLLPAIKKYPDRRIVTADDDILYPIWWLEELVNQSNQHSRDIIGYRCFEMSLNNSNQLLSYNLWKFVRSRESSIRFFATGVSGVCYPIGCFTSEVFNEELIQTYCPTADDVWFKIQSLLTETKIRSVFDYSQHFPVVIDTQENALQKINKTANDLQISKLVNHYELMTDYFSDEY